VRTIRLVAEMDGEGRKTGRRVYRRVVRVGESREMFFPVVGRFVKHLAKVCAHPFVEIFNLAIGGRSIRSGQFFVDVHENAKSCENLILEFASVVGDEVLHG